MITEKMATPLYDEKSAKFRVCAIIKARNIALAIMVVIIDTHKNEIACNIEDTLKIHNIPKKHKSEKDRTSASEGTGCMTSRNDL